MRPPAQINKVIEIDVDTQRKIPLLIRQINNAHKDRFRQPDQSEGMDLIEQITIFTHALVFCIRLAEAKGFVKRGELMKDTLDLMSDCYVDTKANLYEGDNDPDGYFGNITKIGE